MVMDFQVNDWGHPMESDCADRTVGGPGLYRYVRFRAKEPALIGTNLVKYRFLVRVQNMSTPMGYANMVYIEHSKELEWPSVR